MPVFLLTALGSFFNNTRGIFKLVLLGSFIIAIVTFGNWFYSFTSDIYAIIVTASSSLTRSHGGLLGCIMHRLGIDVFMNSAFAIFYSAAQFWLIAVSYIVTYKLGARVYNGAFKAFT